MNRTHKFHSSADQELFLYITRETDWSASKIYFKGNLVHETQSIHPMLEGIQLTIEGLGVVDVKLPNIKADLEIDVDGKPFVEDRDSKKKIDVSGLVQLFYIIAGFSIVSTFLWALFLSSRFPETSILPILIIDLSFGLLYGATAVLISKRVYWFYFVGAGVFTFFTLIDLLDISTILLTVFGIIRLLVRLTFLVFIILKMKGILTAMSDSKQAHKQELDQ